MSRRVIALFVCLILAGCGNRSSTPKTTDGLEDKVKNLQSVIDANEKLHQAEVTGLKSEIERKEAQIEELKAESTSRLNEKVSDHEATEADLQKENAALHNQLAQKTEELIAAKAASGHKATMTEINRSNLQIALAMSVFITFGCVFFTGYLLYRFRVLHSASAQHLIQSIALIKRETSHVQR